MKTDKMLQNDVIKELRWDPILEACQIGVDVNDGVVTLGGEVDTNEKKIATEQDTSTKISMNLYIKYMVSLRCKMVVEIALKQLGLPYLSIELGMVVLVEEITPFQREALKTTCSTRDWNYWKIKRVF